MREYIRLAIIYPIYLHIREGGGKVFGQHEVWKQFIILYNNNKRISTYIIIIIQN